MKRSFFALVCAFVVAAAAMAAPGRVVIVSDTHPAYYNDFEDNASPLSPRPVGSLGDEPPTVTFSRPTETGRGHVLKITNTISGGFVGTDLIAGRVSAAFTRLKFDYKADPALKVNLFVRLRSADYEIGFTGPRSENGTSVWLGQLEGVKADGQWHTLEIPLLRWLRQAQPTLDAVRLTGLCFENRNSADYLLAGFGGNAAGTSLYLDNFQMVRVGGPHAEFAWTPSGDAPDGYGVECDDKADTQPNKVNAKADELKRSFDDLHTGQRYLHVRPHYAGDKWGDTTTYRFEVNVEPPVGALVEPANQSTGCPPTVRIRLHSEQAGVAPASIKLDWSGHHLTVTNSGVSYNPLSEELLIDLARVSETGPAAGDQAGAEVPIHLKDGDKVAVNVQFADENGIAAKQPAAGSFTLNYAANKRAPQDGELWLKTPGDAAPTPIPGLGTFETSQDEWGVYGNEPLIVERTTATAAAGKYSLRCKCTLNASPFTVIVRKSPFDAARYRTVSFDYRIPSRLRTDFVLRVNTGDGDDHWCHVTFCGHSQDGTIIGKAPNIIADDAWHHTEFNLYDMLRARYGRTNKLIVNLMMLSGGPDQDARNRYPGNYANTEYFIDNFFFVPTVGAGAELSWTGADVTGVTAGQISAAPELEGLPAASATVGKKVETAATQVADYGSGTTYFWVRPADVQGNLGAPLVTRLFVVGGKPEIASHWPAEAKAAPATLGVNLRADRAALIDPNSIRMEVNGVQYAYDGKILSYQPATGRIVWDGRRSDPPLRFVDGQKVVAKLLDVRDQAGNKPDQLPSWEFAVDYKQDKSGPIVDVKSRTHACGWYDNFLSDTVGNAPLGWSWDKPTAVKLETIDDSRAANSADERALRIIATRNGQAFGAWHDFGDEQIPLVRYTHLAFDYRIPAGVEADLLLQFHTADTASVLRSVKMNDSATDVKRLGAVPNFVADGAWHHVVLPLATMARVEEDLTTLQAVGFGDLGGSTASPTCKAVAGRGFEIANIGCYKLPSAGQPRVMWSAVDETGIKGYSWCSDTNPRTVPPAAAVKPDTDAVIADAPKGAFWFHIRALDGAGNWGPTTHFLMLPPATATADNAAGGAQGGK